MACNTKIVADIVNSCRSIKGLKPKAWIFNGGDGVYTFGTGAGASTITAVGVGVGIGCIALTGFKDFMNAGYEAVVGEGMPTVFKNKFTANLTSATAAEKLAIDGADNITVFVQSNDGTILAYGATQGLWKTAQGKMANDNNGITAVEFASREGMEEVYSEYVYMGTAQNLDDLLL